MRAERLIKQGGMTMNTIQKIGISMLAAFGLSTAVHAEGDAAVCLDTSQFIESAEGLSAADDAKDATEQSIKTIKEKCVKEDCRARGDSVHKRELEEANSLHQFNVKKYRAALKQFMKDSFTFKECILDYCTDHHTYTDDLGSTNFEIVHLCVDTLDVFKMAAQMDGDD
jgi:hypothetical protein